MKVKVLKLNNSEELVDIDVNEVENSTLQEVSLLNRVRNQALKQGTKKTKGRSEVQGHASKPFRQKGTGNARQGSTKAPHHVGGGVAHGPTPDTTKLTLNKKFKSLVLKKILVDSMKNENLNLVELNGEAKELRKFFQNRDRALLVHTSDDREIVRSLRNLPNLDILPLNQLSALTLLNYKSLFVDLNLKEEFVNLLNK